MKLSQSQLKEIRNHADETKRWFGKVKAYYQNLGIDKAIEKAGRAIVPASCGNSTTAFDNHQYRIGKDRCREGADLLLSSPFKEELIDAGSFEEIFEVTEKVKKNMKGLGDLWSYDTALRIGLNRSYLPKHVYLQSGALEGAIELVKLGLLEKNAIIKGKRYLAKDTFPPFFGMYEPYIIENILCVGKRMGWFRIN